MTGRGRREAPGIKGSCCCSTDAAAGGPSLRPASGPAPTDSGSSPGEDEPGRPCRCKLRYVTADVSRPMTRRREG